ncbi:hypothetical protein D9M71_277860 [compost metagenome]
MALAAAVVFHRPVVVAADMAQAAQAVGAEQNPLLDELLLRADMTAGEAVQRRLAGDVEGAAFGAHIHIVDATRAAMAAQAQAIDQLAGLQPALLHHQLQPDEIVDRLLPRQHFQQRVAVMLGHRRIAQCPDLAGRTQPQPRQHPAVETLRRRAAVEQREATPPQPPVRDQSIRLGRRPAVAQSQTPGVLVAAAVDRHEAAGLAAPQTQQKLAGLRPGIVEQHHIPGRTGQQRIGIAEMVKVRVGRRPATGRRQHRNSGSGGRHAWLRCGRVRVLSA